MFVAIAIVCDWRQHQHLLEALSIIRNPAWMAAYTYIIVIISIIIVIIIITIVTVTTIVIVIVVLITIWLHMASIQFRKFHVISVRFT